MKLAFPDAMWGLLIIPVLVIALALDGQRRRRILERIGHLAQIRRMTESVSHGRRRLKAVALVLGLAAAVVSLARPQRAGVAHMLPRRGLDIVVALDFSKSMLAADVYPTRLARAKYELSRLIDGLKGDRVGLVAFAGVTLSYPLTSDYAAAKLFWRDLSPDDIPVGGTNLGEAIKASLELLKYGHPNDNAGDERQPARILILLTDGADNEGGALAAAREAKKLGVKVFTVGIGSRDGEVVVLKKKDDGTAEYITDPLGAPVRMALDEATLREIARLTDGKYFQVDPERFGVDMVQSAIASEERTEEGHRVVREPEEAYFWFLAPAFALLAIEVLASDRRRRKKLAKTTSDEAGETVPAATGLAKKRRRAGPAVASLLWFALLPLLGGWTGFKRLSPAVQEGNEWMAAGKHAEALAAYDRALAEQPEDLSVHYNRGAALYYLGKFPEAQREFERATAATDPSLKADGYYNMGNALLRQTLPKESIEAYKQALRLRPDDRRAKWNLELALKLLEQQDQEKSQSQSNKDQKDDQKNDPKQDQKQDQKNDQKQDQKNDPKQDQKNDQQKQSGNDQKQPPPKQDDQKDQKDQKQDQKSEQQKKDDKQAENDKKDQQQKGSSKEQQEKEKQQKKDEQQEKDQQSKADQKKPQDNKDNKDNKDQKDQKNDAKNDPKEGDDKQDGQPRQAQAGAGRGRDIDKQDAEAVLDAFERVEPTVQKDLARRKGKNRRPRKDW